MAFEIIAVLNSLTNKLDKLDLKPIIPEPSNHGTPPAWVKVELPKRRGACLYVWGFKKYSSGRSNIQY